MTDKKSSADPEKRPATRWWIALAVAAVILLGGGGAAGYLVGARNQPEAPPPPAREVAGAAAVGGLTLGNNPVGPMVNLDSFIVNILDAQGTRYLKAAITLELNGKAGADEVSERLPQVRDAILLHVGNKTFGELNDLQGKLQLREELIAQLNQLLQKGEVSKVYFTDFVVQ